MATSNYFKTRISSNERTLAEQFFFFDTRDLMGTASKYSEAKAWAEASGAALSVWYVPGIPVECPVIGENPYEEDDTVRPPESGRVLS